MSVSTRFKRDEAEAKLGRRVQSLVAIDGIPAGAFGHVLQLDEIDKGCFDLIVEWYVLVDGKRHHDWFSKNEYERCLVETLEVGGVDV